jgi:hypothetical protein
MPESNAVATGRLSAPIVAVAVVVVLLLAGTVALWAHYGTTVFYEMIVAGLAACL